MRAHRSPKSVSRRQRTKSLRHASRRAGPGLTTRLVRDQMTRPDHGEVSSAGRPPGRPAVRFGDWAPPSRRAGIATVGGTTGPIDTSLNWENSRERIRERSQRYAHGMNYPGNQITAGTDQRRRYLPEEHPSGPIGPFGPIREGFDGDADELSATVYGDYALPGRQEARHGRDQGGREVPAPRNGHVPRPTPGRQARPAAPGGRSRPGAPGPQARPAGPPEAPAPGAVSVPRQRRGRHASGGYDAAEDTGPQALREAPGLPSARQDGRSQPARQDGRGLPARQDGRSQPSRRGDGNQASRRRAADSGAPEAHGGEPRRGPANGYPPRPGAPAPRYPQDQFSAWNEPAAPSGTHPEQPSGTPIELLMAAAPTWADTGEAGTAPPDSGSAHGGVALAERPADRTRHAHGPGDLTRYPDDLYSDEGDLTRYPDDLYSDEEVEYLAADFAEVTALAIEEPVITGAEEEPPVTEAARPTGRSRAAAAKARKAARRKGRTRRRVVVAGVCVPAVAAVAAMAVLNHPGKHSPTAPGAAGSPSAAAPSSSGTKSLGPWQHIGTRADDPTPLTLGQLFPATFSSGGSYVRTAEAGSSDCASALFGSALQSAVRKHGCSQVMRASYLSTAKKMMGTIGVLNLTNSAAASAVGKVTGSSEFIAQLTSAHGPTHNLTKGTGLEEAEVKGHYLILTWVEFTSLHAPSTAAEKTQLKTFSASLINQTANVSLTSRMVTGDPQVP
jgi:hypothetical protein